MTVSAFGPSVTSPATTATPSAYEASRATSTAFAPLDRRRLHSALTAYTTRYLAATLGENRDFFLHTGPGVVPLPGDVVLARVVQIGQHTRLESPVSRRQLLFPGQEILVAYGHRYAPDQFHAVVPDALGPAHLIAAGGLIGRVVDQHESMDDPTTVEAIGLLCDDQGRVTLARHAPLTVAPATQLPTRRPPVIAVLGSSMNSGKSTTLACLTYGLTAAGLRVAAGKVTGTGAGGDPNIFRDAGAVRVHDFTDFGYPTTYKLPEQQVDDLMASLVAELAGAEPDVILIEVADGVYQQETARLLRSNVFARCVDRVVFAAQDALGATAGLTVVSGAGLPVAAVSGAMTRSPLLTREAAAVLPVPVVETFELCRPEVAVALAPSLVAG